MALSIDERLLDPTSVAELIENFNRVMKTIDGSGGGGDIETIKADIENLKTATANLPTLQSDVTQLKSDLAALTERVTALEGAGA